MSWQEHISGPCPVDPDARVRVRWKCGKESEHAYKAGALRWSSWSAAGLKPHDYDITHYQTVAA